MKFKIDHDYHIHSYLSKCSKDPEQNFERILRYAGENGYAEICLTDHYWDSSVECRSPFYATQNFEHVNRANPLPRADGIKFFFGCETDMDMSFNIGIPRERYADFDFIVVPTTHMHMSGFTISHEDAESNEGRARVWVERLRAVLASDLPFEKVGIAHLACPHVDKRSREDYLKTLSLIPYSDMEELFTRAAALGCGIELNQSDMNFSDEEADTVLRPFRIAKASGCKFYLGSDAHHPKRFDTTKIVLERAVSMLGLTEDDKYRIPSTNKA